jgi:lipopolysaccharide biosynthesis glycosyltransferase
MSYRKIFATFLLLSAVLGLPAEKIHVAFCLDNNYGECTGVAAFSLCKNKAPDEDIVIHIVGTETLALEHREKFFELERLFSQIQIRIYDDESNQKILTDSLRVPDVRTTGGVYNWPIRSVAARLVLDKILPNALDKVIYLDGDLLVLGSLKDLWNKLPNENYAIAGIPESCLDLHRSDRQSPQEKEHISDLQQQSGDFSIPIGSYINSGVLVLNLNIIRQDNLFPETIKWLMVHSPKRPDQDAINFQLRGRILRCEGKWNWRRDWRCPNGEHPTILHFGPKPWRLPEKLDNPQSPVFIATEGSPPLDPSLPDSKIKPPHPPVSLEVESDVTFKDKCLALTKGSLFPTEARHTLQQIPDLDDTLQRIGCIHEGQHNLQYDLDIIVTCIGCPSRSEGHPVTIPLKIKNSNQDVAIRTFNANLTPLQDSAPSRPMEMRIKSLPGPWCLCRRDSSYTATIEKNTWALMAFEGAHKKLTIILYLHPPLPAETAAQPRAVRPESGESDLASLRSTYTSSDSPNFGFTSAIFDLLSRKEELSLVQDNDNLETIRFSSIWHWYREMSPWRHYY